jgi:hypothetical protein
VLIPPRSSIIDWYSVAPPSWNNIQIILPLRKRSESAQRGYFGWFQVTSCWREGSSGQSSDIWGYFDSESAHFAYLITWTEFCTAYPRGFRERTSREQYYHWWLHTEDVVDKVGPRLAQICHCFDTVLGW